MHGATGVDMPACCRHHSGDENQMMQSPLAVCSHFAEAVDMIGMATTQNKMKH